MPRQSYYPPEIDRKYTRAPNKQNVETQLERADWLEDNWRSGVEFQELVKEYPEETNHESIRRVFYAYFGPVDDTRTFDEIKAAYDKGEGLKDYWKHRGKIAGEPSYVPPEDQPDDEDDDDEDAVSKEERNDIFLEGYRDGYQDGFEKGRHSVLEELDVSTVSDELGSDAVEYREERD